MKDYMITLIALLLGCEQNSGSGYLASVSIAIWTPSNKWNILYQCFKAEFERKKASNGEIVEVQRLK